MVTGRSLDVLTSLLINFVNCKNLGVDKDKALRGLLYLTTNNNKATHDRYGVYKVVGMSIAWIGIHSRHNRHNNRAQLDLGSFTFDQKAKLKDIGWWLI